MTKITMEKVREINEKTQLFREDACSKFRYLDVDGAGNRDMEMLRVLNMLRDVQSYAQNMAKMLEAELLEAHDEEIQALYANDGHGTKKIDFGGPEPVKVVATRKAKWDEEELMHAIDEEPELRQFVKFKPEISTRVLSKLDPYLQDAAKNALSWVVAKPKIVG